jgi:NAD(P)H-hydrate epimerase
MSVKVFSVEQIRQGDAFTISNEPIKSIDLMERAAKRCADWLSGRSTEHTFKIFCGMGNNGGDGTAIARMLQDDFIKVMVYIVHTHDKYSDDGMENLTRLETHYPEFIQHIFTETDIPALESDDIIVDAIFGSGLSRPITGLGAAIIKLINESKAVIIAIDIPSGLFADHTSTPSKGAIIQADYTLTFQTPKLAFFMPENDSYVGEWVLLDIKIHPDYLASTPTNYYLLTKDDVTPLLRHRTRFSHKGIYGHALLIAGSRGKAGAAILSAHATLRSGAGLVTAHLPEDATIPMQTALPEAMISYDRSREVFSHLPELAPYSAIAIGPGIGLRPETATALKLLIQESRVPLIFDADAINIISENKTWLSFIPAGSIFTPHLKEFERLAGATTDGFERLKQQKEFSVRYKCYVVLKGAFTSISTPKGITYFNPTGNPGMATGGSGDVLTGILLGLLAQHYPPRDTALLGVYLHGAAGDIAAEAGGLNTLIASDIIENLGKAFKALTD